MTPVTDPLAPRAAVSPFGRTATAMITPFTADGELDTDGAQRLATHLVDEGGCDALVLSGTTGESPTTTDAEKEALLRAVVEAVGDRARITAGVGTSDTRHTVALARGAERAGAHGLLVVTPYYSRPTQEAVTQHLRTVADATGLPVMLYDIPGRTGTALSAATLLRLAAHPRIAAVKDCGYDLLKSAKVLAATGLAYYAGCDEQILPLRAIGGAGCISTAANAAPRAVCAVLDAYDAGDTAEAARRQLALVPLIEAVTGTETPGTVTAKARLNHLGLPAGPVRGPLLAADATLTSQLVDALRTTLDRTAETGTAVPAGVPG
ncbi:4-hydroxy-tetrahydrodipicolinate synthase [Streptomyces sioyaensis]|uniref:4-hydroxy-tetrahydrodipicolinate synthase n=1 Tax=Streptomyces sioyaensis TaxID=67364 RepID=A0A4Q1R188_9ACTN|nr:4-hydroxy-tetrahydrodipicolinate synthase [Streptomyces sioyaensis]MBM4791019.1 4-hydroxy-tetrahydrodipicolinate synthase [Streptomyces sioyaensis]RXS65518.1 4-hydroxy-tetrahydrodipicolinate synthase [Streptomyces sioyaensis]